MSYKHTRSKDGVRKGVNYLTPHVVPGLQVKCPTSEVRIDAMMVSLCGVLASDGVTLSSLIKSFVFLPCRLRKMRFNAL